MRTAIVLRRLSTHGGTERFAHGFVRWLLEAGHQVDVWCEAVEAPVQGATVRHLGAGGRGRIWRMSALSRAAAGVPLDPYGAVLNLVRAPVCGVYRAGGGCHRAWVEEQGWSIADALEVRMDKNAVSAASCVVVNSEMSGADLTRWYGTTPARIKLVRNGVDLARFQPRPASDAADLDLVFLGSGFARKGLDTALEALALLPDRHLTVLGADRHTGIFERHARRLGVDGRVHFVGPVPRPEEWLRRGRALVLPTRYDACANAVLEAMASGIPVVTTQRNGAAEVLPHAWMAIADPRDEVALAEVLKRVLEDDSLGSACRAAAERIPSAGAYQALLKVLKEAQA